MKSCHRPGAMASPSPRSEWRGARWVNFRERLAPLKTPSRSSGPKAPLHAIERLANFEDRYATRISVNKSATGKGELSPQELRERSIKRYQTLIELGETVERLTGLGGVYKRQSDDKTLKVTERKRLLREARKAYERAHQLALERNRRVDPFPTGNWLALRYLLREKIDPADVQALRDATKEIARHGQEIWALIGVPDALLLEALIAGALDKRADEVKEEYKRALGPSTHTANTLDSITAQISFMERTIATLRPRGSALTLKALEEVRTFIGEAASGPTN